MEDVGIFFGHLVYFTAIWSILWPFWYISWQFGIFCAYIFGIFCGLLVYFMFNWYIFPRFGLLYQEKSGNPG
jgi:hypothetical protein